MVGVSLVFPELLSQTIQVRADALGLAKNQAEIEIGQLVEQMEKVELTGDAREDREIRNTLRTWKNSIELKQGQNASTAVVLLRMKQEHQRYLNYARLGVGVGSLMSLAGFWLWYVMLQRFQDAQLSSKAKSGTSGIEEVGFE